ncbi:MAG: hypothetical protein ACOCPT_03940 [Halanaeroarchaeum sp.]
MDRRNPTVPPGLRSAVSAALGFGLLVLVVFFVSHGTVAPGVIAMEPIIYVTLASSLALPVVGSLVGDVMSVSRFARR